ncbi:PREDICTED: uncharacterized protein LOC109475422 [Branchiostoma belcheri]|uniref:Metalloendopeptidase n=1 Tax=Branchiostoma belcheri TaxID=7741 RepID=A0A6P4ZCF3_BRABE|nr:PREDICTED: uncharacterized protein LOC109475422 [Branchiostoma belcheri]
MNTLPVCAVLLVLGAGLVASAPADGRRTPPEPQTVTKAILEANEGLNLYQGDIDGLDPNSRNAIQDATRWPNGVIPYVIGSEYSYSCFDTDGNCAYWASVGECSNSPAYMQGSCPQSCGMCGRSATARCTDNNEWCSYWAGTGECQNSADYMNANCQLSCGLCGGGGGGGACTDNHEHCGYWASVGECTNSADYMHQNCLLSCNLCGGGGGTNNNNNGGTTLQTASAGSEVGRIQAAMEEFHRRTCIRFVPRTNEQNYIHIRRSTGCHAYVGVQGGAQEVSLGDGCLGKATIMHELMHAAGFWHEHSRPDRDDWVYIYLENVPQDSWHAFDKHSETRTLGLAYDYGSIMHYESHAFSMNGRQVIVPRHSTNGIVLGAAQDFSYLDLQKLNTLYQCHNGKTKLSDHLNMRASTVSAVLLVFGVGLAASAPADSLRRSPEAESVTKAILEANKGLNLYSGDITGVDPDSRNAITDGRRWPNGVIPYVIGNEFTTSCSDTNGNCAGWAASGECDANPGYMLSECAQSCGLCSRSGSARSCQDNHDSCAYWASIGECQANPNYMLNYCQLSCSVCTAGCSDNNQNCGFWASIGECAANPNYMLVNCQLSCNTCGGGTDGGNNGGDNGGATILTAPAGSEVGRIQAAILEYNQRTCLQFKPRTNERNYVHIKRLTGCNSQVGSVGGMQELSLGTGCLGKGTILHELMHAVGFWHEHQRPDRDDYVTIYRENAESQHRHAFDKLSTSRTLGLSYDYGSIMHYESHAFSTNGRATIVPKLPLNGIVLGAAQDFSSLDLQKINKLYECNK